MCDKSSGECKTRPYNLGDRVETKVLCGRLVGHWIPALIIRMNSQKRTLDLCVLNNKGYNVSKYAVHVPFRFVRRPTYLFKVGDRIATKILRGRKQGMWIPAWIIHTNPDGTYDLCVEQHRNWQVTKYAVHVPGQFLIPADSNTLKWNHSASSKIPPTITPVQIPIRTNEDMESLKKVKDNWTGTESKKKLNNRSSTGDWGNLKLSQSGMDESIHSTIPSFSTPVASSRDLFELLLPTLSSPISEAEESKLSTKPQPNISKRKLLSIQEISDNSEPLTWPGNNLSPRTQWKQEEKKVDISSPTTKHRRKNVSNISNWEHMYEWSLEEKISEHSRSSSAHTDWGVGLTRTESRQEQQSSSKLLQEGNVSKVCIEKGNDEIKLSTTGTDSRSPIVKSDYEFIDSFLSPRKRHRNRQDRIVTIGVSKHRIQFNEMDMSTPLEEIAKWLDEGADHKSPSNVLNVKKVSSISFNNRMIPIRSNMGASMNIKSPHLPKNDGIYSLSDVLGKSLDTSKKGLAFFVGPVNGQLSYKMSVFDVDSIDRDSWNSMVETKRLEDESKVEKDYMSNGSLSP